MNPSNSLLFYNITRGGEHDNGTVVSIGEQSIQVLKIFVLEVPNMLMYLVPFLLLIIFLVCLLRLIGFAKLYVEGLENEK